MGNFLPVGYWGKWKVVSTKPAPSYRQQSQNNCRARDKEGVRRDTRWVEKEDQQEQRTNDCHSRGGMDVRGCLGPLGFGVVWTFSFAATKIAAASAMKSIWLIIFLSCKDEGRRRHKLSQIWMFWMCVFVTTKQASCAQSPELIKSHKITLPANVKYSSENSSHYYNGKMRWHHMEEGVCRSSPNRPCFSASSSLLLCFSLHISVVGLI